MKIEIEGILYKLDSRMDPEDDAKSMVSGSVPASVELMTETGIEVEDGIQHEKVDGESNQNQFPKKAFLREGAS